MKSERRILKTAIIQVLINKLYSPTYHHLLPKKKIYKIMNPITKFLMNSIMKFNKIWNSFGNIVYDQSLRLKEDNVYSLSTLPLNHDLQHNP